MKIILTCMGERRNILDKLLTKYKKHYKDKKKTWPEKKFVTPDEAYSIFYWLVRYSGFIKD